MGDAEAFGQVAVVAGLPFGRRIARVDLLAQLDGLPGVTEFDRDRDGVNGDVGGAELGAVAVVVLAEQSAIVGAVHVHDLRYSGNMLTAEAGAAVTELMSRMGHASTRAARVYLHAREERDRQLAGTLSKMARRS
jgi:hypothetical protein